MQVDVVAEDISVTVCDANFEKNNNAKTIKNETCIGRTLFKPEPNISNLNLRFVFRFTKYLNRTSRCRFRSRPMAPEPEPNRTPASLGRRPFRAVGLTPEQDLIGKSFSATNFVILVDEPFVNIFYKLPKCRLAHILETSFQ